MKAYERLIKYAKVHTTSDEASGTHPSFKGEFDLANILVEEMKDLGLENVFVDDLCYVYGTLPATKGYEGAKPLGLIAHMDTSPDASGKDVKPILHENYDGGDIILPGSGAAMTPEKFPFLKTFIGETVITTDGTTLLGADDKAGISEILTCVERLINEKRPHGTIKICFTPDEEIGEGADNFDIKGFGAAYAFTIDGGDSNCLEYENFNAASAEISIKGFSVHPGDAKDVMINASHLAMEFHSMLPEDETPAHTEKRQGFYHLTQMKGRVGEATLSYIIRDHDKSIFEKRKATMASLAEKMNEKYGEGTVTAKITDSYYNMLEKITPHMHLIENARIAIKNAGMEPEEIPVRGGTDGARLSYDGLPCPNLGTGGFNFHGNFECTTIERMDRAVEVILNLVDIYKDK
jgi:tripeptide aminopeptidase